MQITLDDPVPRRLEAHAALRATYHPPGKPPFLSRSKWLLATAAWLVGMIVLAFVLRGLPLPWWLDGFSGNLVAGAIGSVLFLFLTLHLEQKTGAGQEQTQALVNALGARLYERDRVSEFENCVRRGDVCEISLRPRSGPERLLYQVQAVRPVTYGRDMFIVQVTASPFLATSREYKGAYARSVITSGKHYFARYFDSSWHLTDNPTSADWIEFEWAGPPVEVVADLTADAVVERARKA